MIMECPICYETKKESRFLMLECRHCFCKDCFSCWCEDHFSCPICRSDIKPLLLPCTRKNNASNKRIVSFYFMMFIESEKNTININKAIFLYKFINSYSFYVYSNAILSDAIKEQNSLLISFFKNTDSNKKLNQLSKLVHDSIQTLQAF